MGAGADVYKPITAILRQWLCIPEYLHKMFKTMHVQVIVIKMLFFFCFCFFFFFFFFFFWGGVGQ